jgi:hypothetical protein
MKRTFDDIWTVDPLDTFISYDDVNDTTFDVLTEIFLPTEPEVIQPQPVQFQLPPPIKIPLLQPIPFLPSRSLLLVISVV